MLSLIPSTQNPIFPKAADSFGGFRRSIDRIFDDFIAEMSDYNFDRGLGFTRQSWAPRLDIDEKEDRYILSAEVPGMTDKDVQVEVAKDYLKVHGEKKMEKERKNRGNYLSERSYGSFERTILLPNDVKREKIDASVKDGLLTVIIPKSEESKAEIVKINVHH